MYTVTFCSPEEPPYILDDTADYSRYGFISGEQGDILAYAKQASEGSLITCNGSISIWVEHVRASIPYTFDVNPNSIVFGLNEEDESKLIQWKSAAKGQYTHFRELYVNFEVKHLYFNGLRAALSKLTPAGIQKMIPHVNDFATNSSNQYPPARPPYEEIKLDSCQQRALLTILNCSSGAPVLVTGPFGTGKTRLLVRAAYEILKGRGNRVLMCAHHQNSVDTFVNYFGQLSTNSKNPWRKKFVRVVLNKGYISKNKPKYHKYFKARNDLRSIDTYDLVITTLGTSHTLKLKSQRVFTHILIDEGAQTREPETVSPLCFATDNTKVVIAGDHFQV